MKLCRRARARSNNCRALKPQQPNVVVNPTSQLQVTDAALSKPTALTPATTTANTSSRVPKSTFRQLQPVLQFVPQKASIKPRVPILFCFLREVPACSSYHNSITSTTEPIPPWQQLSLPFLTASLPISPSSKSISLKPPSQPLLCRIIITMAIHQNQNPNQPMPLPFNFPLPIPTHHGLTSPKPSHAVSFPKAQTR
ncbi:hypothetical protein M0R45_020044 [Rubus argutus]|uniref:Uncharacterized protein n=1 Tax=Rubus argutus TaxID=59490 RepID=A0AAW1XAK2_RUBAR